MKMLINGDLVRVPQGAVIMGVETDPTPIRVAIDPSIAIVIDNKPTNDDLIKILIDEELVFVNKHKVQFIGG